VLAKRVEHVDVVARRRPLRHAQARAHFLGEDQVPQALSLPNFIFMTSPNHFKPQRAAVAGSRMRRRVVK